MDKKMQSCNFHFDIVKKTTRVLLCIICVFAINNTHIFGASSGNINTDANNVSITDEATNNIVTNASFETIENILNLINKELKDINSKIEVVRKRTEYIQYPAVRLNVDTPIFGISAVINKKLKITSEVSTSDVASGYSIKDVVKTKKVKVPSFTVASFVVITRDIEISDKMTKADANIAIVKLLDFLTQAKDTNEYLDKQINNILSGYVNKDRTQISNNINESINKISIKNVAICDMLNKLKLLDTENIDDKINLSNNINVSVDEYKKTNQNILTDESKLKSIQENLDNLELQTTMLNNDVEKIYNAKIENIDIQKLLSSVKEKMETQITYIKKHIDESEGISLDTTIPENSQNKTTDSNSNETNTLNKVVQNKYSVTSKDVLTSMQNYESEINGQLETIKKEAENVNAQATVDQNKYQIAENNLKILQETNKMYLDFLNKENRFIKDNINLLLSDSTNKLSAIAKHTTEDICGYIQYLYIDLPQTIKQNSDKTNLQSIVSTLNSIELLKPEVKSVLEYNININKLYNDKLAVNSENMSRSNINE